MARALIQLSRELLEAARESPFSDFVLGEERVICLECGLGFRSLGQHVVRQHGLSADEYREIWGYNRSQSLDSGQKRQARRGNSTLERMEAARKGWRPPPAARPHREQGLRSHDHRRLQISLQDVLDGQAEGLSRRQLAERFGCSPGAILKVLRQAGLSGPGQVRHPHVTADAVFEAQKQGMTLEEMASHFGCSKTAIRSRLKDARRARREDWSPRIRFDVTVEAVTREHEAGLSVQELAKKFNCSEHLIRIRLQGVEAQRKAKRPDVTVEAVLSLRAAGLTIDQMARHFACSTGVISDRLRAARIAEAGVLPGELEDSSQPDRCRSDASSG